MFPALLVCRNMADWNVDNPSFWFNDVLAARDEDEAIVHECCEAATDASDYAGSIGEGDSVGCIRVKMKNSCYASMGR